VVDLDAEAAEDAAAKLDGDSAIGLAADVTDRGAMQRAVATTVERFGGLDVVVANAGILSRAASFRATASEAWECVMEVNLLGVLRTVDAALPEIVERKGHVVAIASVAAFTNGLGITSYAMSVAPVMELLP
jgi:NAD(P)-dependent dehydrogenase (short-subunit alcohol dehydrogenase family)